MNYHRIYSKTLSLLLLYVAVTAFLGSIKLITTNGMAMPVEWISPLFDSYMLPGLILGFVIGGTHLLAAIALWRGWGYAYEAAGVAGFGLIIWVFTELYLMPSAHWLQIIYLAIAIVNLVSIMLLLKLKIGIHTAYSNIHTYMCI